MSPRCQTCKWWRRPSHHGYGVVHELGEAHEVYVKERDEYVERKAEYTVRQCQHPGLRFCETPEANGAAVCDGSEYWAGLFTGPDFGCTRHEAGDVQEDPQL